MKLLLVACAALAPTTVWCDWDDHFHHHGGHGGPSSDPSLDAFAETVLWVLATSGVILFLAGPILVLRTRGVRSILWIVPLANLAMYLLLIYMRPYPGGSAARFRPPGLLYTVVEVAILSALSLLVALLLAAIQWLLQKIRLVVKRSETSAEGDRRGNGP